MAPPNSDDKYSEIGLTRHPCCTVRLATPLECR
jgi:hypothetical protein